MRALLALVALALCLAPPPAHAQAGRGGVQLQTPLLAEQEDSTAVAANPAQVGFLRGWGLSYLHSETRDGPWAGAGDGLFFASPIAFGLAAGAALEWVRPAEDGAPWRTPVTLALAWQYAGRLSIGIASRWIVAADDPGLNSLWALDLGLTLRLGPYLALALAAHGVNDPRPRAGNEEDRLRFGREWSAGLVLRPAAMDYLSLGAEVTYAEALDRLVLRGVVALRPLDGWTVGADVAGWFDDGETGLSLSLSTELAFSMFRVGGGGRMTGLEDGSPGYGGFTVTASVADDGRGSLWRPSRVVQLVLDEELDTREVARLEETLLRAARDPAVAGVLLQPRGGYSAPVGVAQELRWVLRRVQASGRPVACYLEDGSGPGYYLCAGADRVLVNVAGGIRLAGLRMTTLYFGEILGRLGVSFDVLRIGEYKGAPERFNESEPSEPVRRATDDYLSSVYRRWVWDLAHDREVGTSRMQELVDGGPYLAEEAVEAGLADRAVHTDELEDALEELYGHRVRVDGGYAAELVPRRSWPGRPAVAVVHVDGNIVDGESFESGPDWLRMAGARTIARAIGEAAEDRRVKAIVLRVDSPGGSAYGSDIIWRAVEKARRRTPVVASMGSVAASGGYYVASAADEIVATPATLTGSIGIFYGKADLSGLLRLVGVNPVHYKRGRRAGFSDWTRPWTDDEREALAVKVRMFYDRFLDRVVEGRATFETREQVDEVGRGRIWSGARAKQLGLVDEMGGLHHAIERAADRAGLRERPEIIHLPRRDPSLLERAIDLAGLRARDEVPLPQAIEQALEATAPLAYSPPATPMALLPFAFELASD